MTENDYYGVDLAGGSLTVLFLDLVDFGAKEYWQVKNMLDDKVMYIDADKIVIFYEKTKEEVDENIAHHKQVVEANEAAAKMKVKQMKAMEEAQKKEQYSAKKKKGKK